MTEDKMNSYALVVVLDTCDHCLADAQRMASPISINTLTGETECENCGERGQLGQTELLEILMNLED
jgi:hypothetical protein